MEEASQRCYIPFQVCLCELFSSKSGGFTNTCSESCAGLKMLHGEINEVAAFLCVCENRLPSYSI